MSISDRIANGLIAVAGAAGTAYGTAGRLYRTARRDIEAQHVGERLNSLGQNVSNAASAAGSGAATFYTGHRRQIAYTGAGVLAASAVIIGGYFAYNPASPIYNSLRGGNASAATSTPIPKATQTPTPTSTATATPDLEARATQTANAGGLVGQATVTDTPTVTGTATATATATGTYTPAAASTATGTAAPASTSTYTPTGTATTIVTPTGTMTLTTTPNGTVLSVTGTPSATRAAYTSTPKATQRAATPTRTGTSTPKATSTSTLTSTVPVTAPISISYNAARQVLSDDKNLDAVANDLAYGYTVQCNKAICGNVKIKVNEIRDSLKRLYNGNAGDDEALGGPEVNRAKGRVSIRVRAANNRLMDIVVDGLPASSIDDLLERFNWNLG